MHSFGVFNCLFTHLSGNVPSSFITIREPFIIYRERLVCLTVYKTIGHMHLQNTSDVMLVFIYLTQVHKLLG